MSTRLPEGLMPELRAKWIKLAGAREVVEVATAHLKALEGDYQQTLNVCLRFLNLDPARNWRINLETGDIEEATEDAQATGNGLVAAVPG